MTLTAQPYGIVTDIKRFAVHDGDGIRTTVFLKGCPLKCRWCHNPESISPDPQLAFYNEKCTLCGECAKICPNGAHNVDGGVHTLDRTRCIACGKCEGACFCGALKLCGRKMSVDEVISAVAEDKIFYKASGGGMTLSGGEPTMQPGFTLALLKAASEAKINTALDSCGFARREIYELLLPYVDSFLYDIKHITIEEHLRGTGQQNQLIIENLRFLSDSNAKIEIRIPLVPGYNDDILTISKIGELLSSINVTKVKLLPYHDFALSKYKSLGMEDTLPNVERPDKATLDKAASVLREYCLNVTI